MVSHGLPVLRAGDIQKPLINFPFHGGIKHLKELRSDVWLRTAKAWEEGWLQFGCDVASWKALISIRWKTIFNVDTDYRQKYYIRNIYLITVLSLFLWGATVNTLVYVGILPICGGSSQTNTCHIYYQTQIASVNDAVSKGRVAKTVRFTTEILV